MVRASNAFRVASLAMIFALACGVPDLPEDVAKGFWEAMRLGDREKAATFVTDESLPLLDDGIALDEMEKILLGEVLRNETSAVVRTSMITRENDIDLNVVFHTHLVLQQDEWKVDLGPTQQELSQATFSAGMKFLGEAVGKGIEELGEVLEQGAAEVRDAVRDAMEELAEPEGEAL